MIARSLDERLFDLMDIKCRSISFPNDLTLKADLESIEKEVKEHLPADVVDVVMAMITKLREGIMLERLCDRKAPWTLASNLYNHSWTKAEKDQEDATKICNEELAPLLERIYGENGRERADRIFEVCGHKCWADQNMEDWETAGGGRVTGSRWRYKDDAVHDELYANYGIKTMGFATYPPVSKNVSIKLVCFERARSWTAENVPSTRHWLDYGPRGRQAAFEIAEERAKTVLDGELVDTIVEMAIRHREYTHYLRSGDQNPLARLMKAADGVVEEVMSVFAARPVAEDWKDSEEEAKKVRERLRRTPDVGDKADVLYELCEHCAWYEQNKIDYDSSSDVSKNITGEAQGYEDDWKREYHEVQLCSYRLGFD